MRPSPRAPGSAAPSRATSSGCCRAGTRACATKSWSWARITITSARDTSETTASSALIHIAKQLAAEPPARTVVFVAFSGEEGGLLGSANYVKQPVFPLASTYAMVNLDMVGRIKNNRLIVFGAGTAAEFPALLDSLNTTTQFDLKASGDGWGPSDHASFYGAGKPVLHVFTDLHEDYHRATDDWDKIEVDGLERVANFTADVVRTLANRKAPLTFINVPPPPPPAASASGGGGAYLGTIPDMTENPGGSVEVRDRRREGRAQGGRHHYEHRRDGRAGSPGDD
jgi:hypothetical protein